MKTRPFFEADFLPCYGEVLVFPETGALVMSIGPSPNNDWLNVLALNDRLLNNALTGETTRLYTFDLLKHWERVLETNE